MGSDEIDAAHREVLAALEAVAPDDPAVGERIRIDRRSQLRHLGVRTPVRRKLVGSGFSFSDGEVSERLEIWDGIWQRADCADVMFAVLDDYRERGRSEIGSSFWASAVAWIDRVDNWAHADDLARVYSWALAAEPQLVYDQLVHWNDDSSEWKRRISLVSTIHYSGRRAVFVGPERLLPLVIRVLDDPSDSVQKAIGWVLREMHRAHPGEIEAFLLEHGDRMTRAALRRATERLDPTVRARLRG